MTKKQILDYVMHTPYNTNRQVLSTMLDALEEELTGIDISQIIDKSITEITSDTTTIGDSMFQYCKSLVEANFPEATIIESYAFNGCSSLKTINCPTATVVGSYAFSETGLEEVVFPAIEAICTYAFCKSNNLKKADFPVAKAIGASAFAISPLLDTLILRSPEVCLLIDIGAFAMTPIHQGEGYIYVPKNLVEKYKTATNWIAFRNKIRAIEDYPDITGGN